MSEMTLDDDAAFEQRVRLAIARGVPMDLDKVNLDSTFGELGLQSIDIINIVFALEREFKFQFILPQCDAGNGAIHLDSRQIRELLKMVRGMIDRSALGQ
ncbi:phosphopantetheine-binding protein [Pararhodospirillum oryzae]|uniref:Carrier domain-containing protein n=1 Tax=Pararhodospirillum oryzae TaxID=478448 RepID=A0A512HA22_9PROT|nr:phosphopantetheine-binding protein [Pararhodospirillum oryzae]GEO82307.1 hypothetical protein ROR02_24380 [Pararhodospirillum oryzae]